MSNGYRAATLPNKVKQSRRYVFIEVPNRQPSGLNKPITDFSAINSWGHTSSCPNYCNSSTFPRICPTHYFRQSIQQNFGWRYGVDNNVEFHQAIDIVRPTGTPVYNVFKITSEVTRGGFYDNCGITVQIYDGILNDDGNNNGIYATYMHLNSRSVSQGNKVAPNAQIGTVGSTGTSSSHLHFSVAKGTLLSAHTAAEIAKFIDPLRYMT